MSRPAPAAQPSWIQRNPLLAGIAGGLAGTWLGHMIFGATETSARTTEGAEGEQAAGGAGSNGMLLLLMVMGGGALWWYMRSRRTPAPNFSGSARVPRAVLSWPNRLVQVWGRRLLTTRSRRRTRPRFSRR